MSATQIDDHFHIVPVNDFREHDSTPNSYCWCHPRVEMHDNIALSIHNALDGRELYETGERRAS